MSLNHNCFTRAFGKNNNRLCQARIHSRLFRPGFASLDEQFNIQIPHPLKCAMDNVNTEIDKMFEKFEELYAPFKDIDFVTLIDPISGESATKSVELPEETKNLLKKIGMSHILSSQGK
jgi:hypothetical protein